MPSKSIAYQASWLLGAQVTSLAFGAVFGIVTARVLGPSGKGVLAIAMLVPGVLALIFNLGIGIANTYFTGQGRFSPGDLSKNSLLIGLGLGVVASLGFIALLPVVGARFFPHIGFGFLILGATMVPMGIVNEYLAAILLGLQRIKELAIYRVGVSVLTLIVLLALLSFRIWGALLAVFIGNLGAFIYLCLTFSKGVLAKGQKPFFSVLRETVGYGVRGHLGNVMQFLNYRLDSFLVNYFLSPYYVGIYSVAVTIGELIWLLPNAVSQSLFAQTSASLSNTANLRTPILFRQILIISSISCIMLIVFAKYLIPILYGDKFKPSILPLLWLLPGIFSLSLSKILSGDLSGRGKVILGSYASLISFIVTIILDFILIPRHGVIGASIASSISYTINMLTLLLCFTIISKVKLTKLLRYTSSDILPIKRFQSLNDIRIIP